MKSDAASVGIKDGTGDQMIKVDQIRCGDHKSGFRPMLAPDKRGNKERCDPMPTIMEEGLEKLYASIQSLKKL